MVLCGSLDKREEDLKYKEKGVCSKGPERMRLFRKCIFENGVQDKDLLDSVLYMMHFTWILTDKITKTGHEEFHTGGLVIIVVVSV